MTAMETSEIRARLLALEANDDALISGDLAEVRQMLPLLVGLPARELADLLIAWAVAAPSAVGQLLSAAARADDGTFAHLWRAVVDCAQIWEDGGPDGGIDDMRRRAEGGIGAVGEWPAIAASPAPPAAVPPPAIVRPRDDRPPMPGAFVLTGERGWTLQV